jgi:DedD protein
VTDVEPIKPVKSRTNSSIQAWALQVGSFSEMSNAQVLRDRLRAKAYPAYIDQQKAADKISYRVRIGPELDHGRVETLRKSILAAEKIDGLIVTHP